MHYSDQDFYRIAREEGSQVIPDEPYRDEFRRDFARILHSPSFRRLVGKTQLFPGQESDFLVVEYENKDKVFVPVALFHLVAANHQSIHVSHV